LLAVRLVSVAAFSSLVLGHLAGASLPSAANAVAADAKAANRLSIMTYNVAGLPFPAALDRTGALQEIGSRLANLRREGLQPRIVLLQEAFTPEAKSIAALAGYRYVARGPGAHEVRADETPTMPLDYRSAESWSKGETEGKWADSGLLVLSDYPIVHVARRAFAADACAGFDCLAAKGLLLAWIKVPGLARPLVVGDTHLNSRHATGVSTERADAAYAEQLREAGQFVAGQVPPSTSIVFAGDFNVGHDRQRVALADPARVLPGPSAEATSQYQSAHLFGPADRDMQAVVARGKDKQFYRPGTNQTLRLQAIGVPFGIASGGYRLSDHLGYVVSYAAR